MDKKVIAIYADSFRGKVGLTLPYMSFVKLFGIPRLVTPDDDPNEIVENCDALIIPGGADVDSYRYNEAPHPYAGRANVHYEYMDRTIAAKFIEAEKPIIGICRGMQSLNVMFGGTLYQHIIGHNQGENRVRTDQTMITDEFEEIKINSLHHQAVNKLGDGLSPIGYTAVYSNCQSLYNKKGLTLMPYTVAINKKEEIIEYYSIVEAFEHETLPIIGFQYHPKSLGLC